MSSPPSSVKEKILTFLLRQPRHRFTPKEIQKRLGLPEIQVAIDALRELAKEGKVVRLKKNHYALPEGQNLLIGKVHAHPNGFGFLIPEERGREDLYLSRREMRRVMHGDRILVRIERKREARPRPILSKF